MKYRYLQIIVQTTISIDGWGTLVGKRICDAWARGHVQDFRALS